MKLRKLAAVAALMVVVDAASGRVLLAADQKEFVFDGTRSSESFVLEDVLEHTVYEDREVPDTCTRQVRDGTRTECRQVPETTCHPVTRNECSTEYHQECHSTTRNECSTEYSRECHYVPRQECHYVSRRECGTQNVCRNVPDQVCSVDASGRRECQNITRRECNQESVCRDVPDQVCETRQEYECGNEPHQVCRTVPDTVCSSVPEQVCHNVTRDECSTSYHSECEQVPNYREETYACTKTIKVPAGKELDMAYKAVVDVSFGEVPAGVRAHEVLRTKLSGENLSMELTDSAGELILLQENKVSSKKVDAKHRELKAAYTINLLSKRALLAPFSSDVANVELDANAVRFQMPRLVIRDGFKAHVTIGRKRFAQKSVIVADSDLTAEVLTLKDNGDLTEVVIDLSRIPMTEEIGSNRYWVQLDLSLDKTQLKTVLNSKALPEQISHGTRANIAR